MTKRDIKSSLEMIRKLADDFDTKREGRGTGGAGAAGTVGQGASGQVPATKNPKDRPAFQEPMHTYQGPTGSGGGAAVTAIKEMQAAMQEFANKVTAYSADQKTGAIKDEKKDFNDFLTEQYLATSDVKGVEWDKDTKAVSQAQKQKRETDLIEMDYVVDGLKRIGGRTNELARDNVWDFRTNNALKNIYAFASALINVSKDFGKPEIKTFNSQSLQAMYDNIPEDDNPAQLPAEDKVAKAKVLTPLIKSLSKFYEYYIRKIAMNPQYRGYIEGTYDMYTVKPGGTDPGKMTEQETAKWQKDGRSMTLNHVVVPTKDGNKPVDINYTYLSDPAAFTKLLESLGYTPNEVRNPDVQKRVLDAVRNHVTALMSGRY